MPNNKMIQIIVNSIKSGVKIIPVIGFDAYKIIDKDTQVHHSYLDYLTRKLAVENKIEIQDNLIGDIDRFSSVYNSLLLKRSKPKDVKQTIIEAAKEIEPLVDCSFLEKLVRIVPFKYYINATFMHFLESALINHRSFPTGNIGAASYPYVLNDGMTSMPQDLPSEDNQLFRPIIYNLFGTYEKDQYNIFLTDDDILNFTIDLNKKYESCLGRLKMKIEKSSLLFLGCNFPDWLFRFFLNTLKPNLLSDKENEIFLDKSSANPTQTYFIEKHSFYQDATDADQFINELFQKFTETNQVIGNREKEYIFISYAWEDQLLAIKIADWLISGGKNVWMDVFKLNRGDELNPEIAKAINECKLFCPIITKASMSKSNGYVQREWAHFKGLDLSKKILPIVKEVDYVSNTLNFNMDLSFNRNTLLDIRIDEKLEWNKNVINNF
jgi:hypothetical protein